MAGPLTDTIGRGVDRARMEFDRRRRLIQVDDMPFLAKSRFTDEPKVSSVHRGGRRKAHSRSRELVVTLCESIYHLHVPVLAGTT